MTRLPARTGRAVRSLRTLYWNAGLAGALLVAASTAFIAYITATGSMLGPITVTLAGGLVVGLWLWEAGVGPQKWRLPVVGMLVFSSILAVRVITWSVAVGLPTQGLGTGGAVLLSGLAAPSFGVALLAWSLKVRAQPPTSTDDFRQLRRRWVLLQYLMGGVLLGVWTLVVLAR